MGKWRTQIIIDEAALKHNIQCVKSLVGNTSPIIAMVKANAYGHGMKQVSRVIAPDVNMLGVACLEEAKKLRAWLPNQPILLNDGIFSTEEWHDVFVGQFDVVIHAFWQIESLLNYQRNEPTKINVWLKIDTGMHRLGFSPEDALTAYERLRVSQKIHQPIGVMTHFACADEQENPMTAQQIQLFRSTIASFPSSFKVSLANSAGIIAWPEARQGYVRPGLMIYGISPFADKTGADLGLKPVMCVQSHILATKICREGETVGYGATWRAKKTSFIAIVAAGYGDGYPRHISSDAVVWCAHHYFPIIGRVSMDMLAIDITHHSSIHIGDQVELWGPHLPVERVAQFAHTSPYEIVTQVKARGV